MDIEVHRSFIHLLLAAALTAAYVVTMVFVAKYLMNWYAGIGALVVAGALSVSFLPLVRVMRRFTDYLIYRDNYDFRGVLSKMASTIPSLQSAEQLGHFVCVNLTEALNLQWCLLRSSTAPGPDPFIFATDAAPMDGDLDVYQTAFRNIRRVPLEINARALGEIVVATKHSSAKLRPVDQDLLNTVAYQAAVMLENFQLLDSLNERIRVLQQTEASRRLLHRRLTETEEATRAAISRDLHDGALQLMLHVVRLSESEASAKPPSPALENITKLGRDIAAELRRVCTDLRPHVLDHLNLPIALESFIARQESQFGITISLDIQEEREGLSQSVNKSVELILYRVISEALFNVIRHADANAINVRLMYEEMSVTVEVRDNGVGFSVCEQDLVQLSEESHMGVIGMFERVRGLDGSLTITKAAGSGTEVVASVPIVREAIAAH
ncbi:ATP-binding protein [Diaminobutyricibacter sp. McL0618]|uniref:GAF domain-containing sensor histidine kinase n=1 Tax=Leifsonia sp. McL0618 TaxID=3415677 RepID=UPI003CE86364